MIKKGRKRKTEKRNRKINEQKISSKLLSLPFRNEPLQGPIVVNRHSKINTKDINLEMPAKIEWKS